MSCLAIRMHRFIARGYACECGAVRCAHCEQLTEFGSDHATWCASYMYRYQPAERPLPQRLNDCAIALRSALGPAPEAAKPAEPRMVEVPIEGNPGWYALEPDSPPSPAQAETETDEPYHFRDCHYPDKPQPPAAPGNPLTVLARVLRRYSGSDELEDFAGQIADELERAQKGGDRG
jgi:hypothetical protein